LQISAGINGALALAIGLTDPATSLSLLDYLRGVAKAGALDLIVTGHSLGGAIAVVATAWLNNQLPKERAAEFFAAAPFVRGPNDVERRFCDAFRSNLRHILRRGEHKRCCSDGLGQPERCARDVPPTRP
jgi:alpha-beta hydrolase superfamily lysophospholipase